MTETAATSARKLLKINKAGMNPDYTERPLLLILRRDCHPVWRGGPRLRQNGISEEMLA